MNWLFLRGLTREQRHWGHFRRVFEKKIPQSKVHCLDLPGSGTEYERSSPSKIAEITDDLRIRWMPLKEQSNGPWALLAISLGGMIGFDWLDRYSADFSQYVVINSSAANLSPIHNRLRLLNAHQLLMVGLHRDPWLREHQILKMTTNKAGADLHEVTSEWANYARENPPKPKVALQQLRAAIRFKVPDKIKAPTLVLASGADRFTDPECSRRLAVHLGARLKVHPSAGHDLPLEEPEWVSEQIIEWQGKLSS